MIKIKTFIKCKQMRLKSLLEIILIKIYSDPSSDCKIRKITHLMIKIRLIRFRSKKLIDLEPFELAYFKCCWDKITFKHFCGVFFLNPQKEKGASKQLFLKPKLSQKLKFYGF